jgi:hypothetical protein
LKTKEEEEEEEEEETTTTTQINQNITSMRTIQTIALVLCLSFITNQATAQCYQVISDQTGYIPRADQISLLEAAACALLDSIPQPQRDSFGIYEVGFYVHGETTSGGYPEAFQAAIDNAKAHKPYYILFGKQSDSKGLCTRFWVDLELPLGGEFSCLNLISPSLGLRSGAIQNVAKATCLLPLLIQK